MNETTHGKPRSSGAQAGAQILRFGSLNFELFNNGGLAGMLRDGGL
jgi:hypothetical protein